MWAPSQCGVMGANEMMRIALMLMLLLVPVAAQATTLEVLRGQLIVNSGSGFKSARSGQALHAGDIVVADPGAAGVLVYPGGCAVPIVMGVPITVQSHAPCREIVTGSISPPILLKDGQDAARLKVPPLRPAGP